MRQKKLAIFLILLFSLSIFPTLFFSSVYAQQNQTLNECNDGKDNDTDGKKDADDPECKNSPNTVCENGKTECGVTPKSTSPSEEEKAKGDGTCKDALDNDGDGRYDWDGVGGKYEPDPSCFLGGSATEIAKENEKAGLISCTNYCSFSDILRTINNLITFLITVVFIPVVIIMFMYAGYRYLTAQGDPKKLVNLKSLLKHIFLGILIILCAWLVVKTILTVLVKDEDSALQFLEK